MAEAKFVGPTSAEQHQASMTNLLTGLQNLQRFREFTTEQDRLNKIEEVKNKNASFLLLAQRYGDGDATLGLKQIANDHPDMLKNYLQTMGWDEQSAGVAVSSMMKDDPSARESTKYMADALWKLSGNEGEPVVQQAQDATKSVQQGQDQGTQLIDMKGATPSSAKGEAGGNQQAAQPMNLGAWDLLSSGKIGTPEQQQAYKDYMALQEKYKKLGFKAEDQGMGGPARLMYLTPRLGEQWLSANEKNPQTSGRQIINSDRAKREGDTSRMTGGSVDSSLRDTVMADTQAATKMQATIDQARQDYLASLPPTAVDASGRNIAQLPPEVKSVAPVYGNINNKPPVTMPVEQAPASSPAGSPAGNVASAPPVIPGSQASAALSSAVGNTTASLEGASNQDVRKAQVFSERLKNMVSRDAYIALAKSDPEGARAFARQKASDEAFNSMYGLLVDPQNELAFRRMKASGELKARVDLEKAQAVAAGRQLDIMQSELDLNRDTLEFNKVIKPAEIDARIAEARAKTEEAAAALAAAKNGPALAAAQLGIAQADLARARLMADAAQFSQKYAPVKEANGTYIKATQDYEDFVQAAMTRGGGKMPMDANTLAQLNVLTNHVNASIRQLNAVGQDSLKETWSMISEWPPSKMVEGNFIWRVSGGLVGKAPQIVQDTQTPAAAKATEKSSPASKPAGGKTADDVANDFVNRQ